MSRAINALIVLIVVFAIMTLGHEIKYDTDFIAGWFGCLLFQYLNQRNK